MRALPVVAFLLSVSLFAQEKPALTESIEVRVSNVEVVVTDRAGKHVRGLTAADFEVYENGVLQPITNFSEYAEDPSPATGVPAPTVSVAVNEVRAVVVPRRIVLFIDRVVLSDLQRESVFNSYSELLRKTMRPGDEAMIATYGPSMRIATDFTSDLSRLEKSLREIGKNARTNWERDEQEELENLRRMMESTPAEAGFDVEGHMATSVRQLAAQRLAQTKKRVQSLNALLTSLAGLEGRKILVLSSDKFGRLAGYDLFIPRGAEMGPYAEANEFDAQRLLQSLSNSANSAGFTIYAFHPRGVEGTTSSAEHANETSEVRQYMLLQNDAAGLEMLARDTGGALALGPADVAKSISTIADDLGWYYSLGYRSKTSERRREVTVKVKRADLTARNRKSFVTKTPEEQLGDRVIANLFRPSDKKDELNIKVRQGLVRRKGSNNVVPIQITIPIGQLTALPAGGSYSGAVSLYIASADPRGGYSNVIRQTKPFTIPADEYAGAKNRHYTYEVEIISNGAKVSIAVIDETSKIAGFEVIDLPSVDANRPGPKGINPSEKTPAEKRGEGWSF